MDPDEGELNDVVNDNAEQAVDEDRSYDNLQDAADALEDDAPGEEPDADGDEPDEPALDDDPDDEVLVSLDGDRISLKELKAGYLKGQDYTRKTTETAQERERVTQERTTVAKRAAEVETVVQNLQGFLARIVPDDPPASLAQTNPAKYIQRKAQRDAVIAELSELLEVGGAATAELSGISDDAKAARKSDEDAKLVKAMPHLSDPSRRAAFDAKIKEAAAEFGFTPDEVARTLDHRVLRLVHYARIGQRAEENQRNAKRRVEAPKTGRAKAVAPVNVENRKAMHRLSKSGSLQDAMSVDFE